MNFMAWYFGTGTLALALAYTDDRKFYNKWFVQHPVESVFATIVSWCFWPAVLFLTIADWFGVDDSSTR